MNGGGFGAPPGAPGAELLPRLAGTRRPGKSLGGHEGPRGGELDGGPGDFLGWGSPSPASPLGQRPGCRWGVQLSPEGVSLDKLEPGHLWRCWQPGPACPCPPCPAALPRLLPRPLLCGQPHHHHHQDAAPTPTPFPERSSGRPSRAPWAGGRPLPHPGPGCHPLFRAGLGTGQGQGTGAGGGSTARALLRRPKEKWEENVGGRARLLPQDGC